MKRSWLSVLVPVSAAVLVAGLAVSACSTEVKDTGKWGNLTEGGDISLLHDPGTYCVGWDASQYSTKHECKTSSECDSWAQTALPPHFPEDGFLCQMDGSGSPVCLQSAYCTAAPQCNVGATGDAYCSAWAEAWMQPGVQVHGVCADDPEFCYDQKCMFDACPDIGTRCDPTKVCVKHADGSFGCETPCSG